MSVRLALSVEGRTEKEFVDGLLSHHLQERAIEVTAIIVTTKMVEDGPNHTGGAVSLDRASREVRRLLGSFDHVSTLYDFYGFRGRLAGEGVEALEERLGASVGSPRFSPYVQRYEFEALLFARPDGPGQAFWHDVQGAISEITARFGSPEDINDAPETAPSRRLDQLFLRHRGQGFRKALDGPLLAMDIGLPAIRRSCPRFNAWLARLEALAPA